MPIWGNYPRLCTWGALERDGRNITVPPDFVTAWDVSDYVRKAISSRPEWLQGKLTWELLGGDWELWFLPDDHGPTVDTGVRLVVVEG